MRFMFTWLQSFWKRNTYLSRGGSNDNVLSKLHNVQTISNDIKIVYKESSLMFTGIAEEQEKYYLLLAQKMGMMLRYHSPLALMI